MNKINEGIFRYINHLLELFMKKQYQMIQIIIINQIHLEKVFMEIIIIIITTIIIIIRTIVINNQALLDVESMYRKF